MISVQGVESWVRSGESETIEFKRTTGERREAARTVCAMLNHRGGRVLPPNTSHSPIKEAA